MLRGMSQELLSALAAAASELPGGNNGNFYALLQRLCRATASGSDATLTNRYDLSVNGGRVDAAQSESPVMVTNTTLNPAGGFTGGGTGNKAILGFKGHSGLPLGQLQTISFEWEVVSPIEPGGAFSYPYINLVVELSPGQYKILAIDPNASGTLNIGTLTTLAPNKFRFDHVATADQDYVQVVNAFSSQAAVPPVPAMPVVSPPVPIAAGSGPSWTGASFRYSDILASFPGARLVDVYTGDGGLPGPPGVPTITPAMMMIVGDSSFRRVRYLRIGEVLFNGTPA